jgi:hypothetical protein
MIQKPKHFGLEELVCPHVYYKYGEMAWQFLDQKQLILLDWVRERLGAMFINNWHEDQWINSDYVQFIIEKTKAGLPIIETEEPVPDPALFSQRGLRCNICGLNYAKTQAGIIYVSPHFLGKGDDYDVKTMEAEEVRKWLIQHQTDIPYPIRLEKGVQWVHMDCEEAITGEKVQLVNP